MPWSLLVLPTRNLYFVVLKNNIFNWRLVGEKKKHLKLKVIEKDRLLDGIGFKLAKVGSQVLTDSKIVNLAFNIELNKWNGAENIQINIKDINDNCLEGM